MKNLAKSLRSVLAIIMVLAIVLCAVGCGGKNAANVKIDNSVVNDVVANNDASDSRDQADSQTAELSREELEQIVTTIDETIDTSGLTDEQLSQMADELLNGLGKGDNASVDIGKNKDAYDENGAMTKPFDEVYPELIENGSVEFSNENLLVKLSNSKGGKISAAMAKAGVAKLEQIVPLENASWYKASLVKGTDVKTALAELRDSGEVLLAEYDYQIKTSSIDHHKDFHKDYGFDKNKHKKDQWYLHHCGIPDGFNEMKHDGGQQSVIVAVIDTGVDYDHEDLSQNIWKNTDEIPNNNKDDDKNGYIDDYYGVNIVAGKGNGDDDNGHGTHVAGIIAAQNNNIGTVGIAYNTTIMPIKAAMASGYLNWSDVAKAILYAYENGAEVINMSFGGSTCSIAVQDALATAYTRCVLVASAGNDGENNEPTLTDPIAIPNYPAALTYVLGVMAVDKSGTETYFTNYDVKLYNGVEYELYAPGYDIMSTLPDDRYGSLSGTSMAAPVVAGMAAILRSEFADRDMYPTKFIYGQLTATSENYATCLDPDAHGSHNLPQIANLHAALTKLPTPDVNMQDFAAFDTEGITGDNGTNNGDGVIDAGETIALGLILRNRWGMSENTMVTIDTKSTAGISDPYITIVNPTVNYDTVGTYSTQDCGKIFTDELHTGWENPFFIKIAKDCPNDYIVKVNVTITCENALDPEDNSLYSNKATFTFTVRNGVVLPQIIDEDMTLTPDNLYIIPNTTIINEGATVTVMPGTHIQFWSDDPKDPYADTYIASLTVKGTFDVRGSKENPVYIYPSDLMSHYNVNMGESDNGFISLKYADVTNLAYVSYSYSSYHPVKNTIGYADRCTFRFNYGSPMGYRYLLEGNVRSNDSNLPIARFTLVENSVFYKMGYYTDGSPNLHGTAKRCIFADCNIDYSSSFKAQNCVFLGNTFFDQTKPNVYKNSSMVLNSPKPNTSGNTTVAYCEETGTTYIRSLYEIDPLIIKELGGSPLIINDETELKHIHDMPSPALTSYPIVIEYKYINGKYCWYDGTPIGAFLDTNNLFAKPNQKNIYLRILSSDAYLYINTTGYQDCYVYEIDGKILPTDITFNEYEVNIDTGTTYQLSPKNNPVQLNNTDFIYESRNESVVTVSDTGLVTPVGVGSTDVYVYSEDKAVYNYVTFNVVDYVALENIDFTCNKSVIAVGETLATSVTFTPDNTTRKNVTYTSSDVGVISVDSAGTLTGVSSGSATITATCEGISRSITLQCYVKATSLDIEQIAMSMTMDSDPVLPEVTVSEGGETEFEWQSTDEEVLQIVDNKPVLLKEGTTTLIVTDTVSGLSDTILVYVTQTKAPKIVEMQHNFVLTEEGRLLKLQINSSRTDLILENVDSFYYDFGSSSLIFALLKDGTFVRYYNRNTTVLEIGPFDEKIVDVCADLFSSNSNIHLDDYFVITESGKAYAFWGASSSSETIVREPVRVLPDEKIKEIEQRNGIVSYLTEDGKLYMSTSSANASPKLIARDVTSFEVNGGSIYISNGYATQYSFSSDSYSTSAYDYSDFDMISMRYLGIQEIGVKDGVVYIEKSYNSSEFVMMPSVINPVLVNSCAAMSDSGYEFAKQYVVSSDGFIYDIDGSDCAISRMFFTGQFTDDNLKIADTNITENNTLSDSDIKIEFNKELEAVSVVLYENGTEISSKTSIYRNELTISSPLELLEGAEYSLVISANATRGAANTHPAEDLTINFVYKAKVNDKTDDTQEGDTPDDTEGSSATTEKVVHESVIDTSIERIYTPSSFIAKVNEIRSLNQYNSAFYNNVMLNRISTDTTVEHWLRILAPSTEGKEIPLGHNYWGTVNETAIGLQLIDYTDFINYSRIMYAPYLTTAPEDTFPFVTSVKVLNKYGEEVYTVGNEQITVRVTFNRDMDTSIPLQVRFGSAYPYGDYEIEGVYVDARTWEGKYKLTTIIEGGTQYFTIENGCSATDDLELMRDRARFGFEIDTTEAQALIMQGEAHDTGIRLTWTQDDFDTLMGYNVYRSTSEDGYYTRVNSSVIPADTMEFFDDTVEPGVLYYYNFTVVQTDLSESIPSGKIVIMSKDTMAPDIYHSPVYNATTGSNLIISATVTDNLNITYARVYYRIKGSDEWRIAVMNSLNDKYSAIIIADHISIEGLEYYIEAFDGVSYTYKGSAENPYVVVVQEVVSGDAMGDINGDGIITNLDALMMLKAINDQLNLTAEQFARADLDGDGNLAAKEALRILQYVSGTVGSVDMRQ